MVAPARSVNRPLDESCGGPVMPWEDPDFVLAALLVRRIDTVTGRAGALL